MLQYIQENIWHSNPDVFLRKLWNFEEHYFEEHLQTVASNDVELIDVNIKIAIK